MKKSVKNQPVTMGEFESTMNSIKKEFNRVDDKFAEVDERFDQVDAKLAEHDKRFDRMEKVMETTLEIVKSIDEKMTVDRAFNLPKRVEALEEVVIIH